MTIQSTDSDNPIVSDKLPTNMECDDSTEPTVSRIQVNADDDRSPIVQERINKDAGSSAPTKAAPKIDSSGQKKSTKPTVQVTDDRSPIVQERSIEETKSSSNESEESTSMNKNAMEEENKPT